MKKFLSGILLILAGLACLSITTGDPSRPSLIAISLCLISWVVSGFTFLGRKRGVHIVTILITVSTAISIATHASNLQAPTLSGIIMIFFLYGGLASIFTIFASIAMIGSPSESSFSIEPLVDSEDKHSAARGIRHENNVMLKAEDLHKSYNMGTTEVKVLKGVNLVVKEGEFIAIVGASGSGKSTLLHILGTLDKPNKGTLKFESRFKTSDLNRFRNKMVGFVFQFYHLLDELSVLENVFLPAMTGKSILGWFACRKQAKNRAKELLNQLGLAERIGHKPYQLSGGERQRVAIGRALMNEPKLLLADEPTGNLDSATGNGILEVLETLNRAGQTIVMVTHDERIAQRAGRIVTLVDGKIEHKNPNNL